MDMMGIFKGTGVALVTPFDKKGKVDKNGLLSVVESCINGGVDYLVVMGTTAESATLSVQEKKEAISIITRVNNQRLPLVLGIGGNNTAAVIQEIEQTDLQHFDAILSVTPMYNKPTQNGIFEHFNQIQQNSPLPILLYNVPSRTGVNMTAATTLKLATLDNIIGIKEASPDFTQVLALLKDRPKDFLVISGDDTLALPTVSAGGEGVISVVAQGFPEDFSSMIRLGLEGNGRAAYEILYEYLPVIESAFAEGNPAGIKHVLQTKNKCQNFVRLPLVPVSEGLAKKIESFVKRQSVVL